VSFTAAQFMTETNSDQRGSDDAVDVALMRQVMAGDHAAFEKLVLRHQHAVVGTVSKMMGNPRDAEDIAQQVFVRLWKSAPRYKATAKFTTFLFTITRNLVFNESRKRKRRKEHSLEEQEEEWHQELSDSQEKRPDEEALQAELKVAVDRAIDALPEKQRMAVILRRYENLPYEEIADVLELSVSAVKSQLFRARTTLRASLEHYLEE
jgi:RNA polymerase sigma-70 factor (ECF subfamily)